MKTKENSLWKWLKEAEGKVPAGELHWRRIEDTANAGTADIDACYHGGCAIIELKSVARAKKIKTKIKTKLTTAQAMYLNARWRAGGSSFLLIEVGGDKRYLIPGSQVLDLVKPTLEAVLQDRNLLLFGDAVEVLSYIRFPIAFEEPTAGVTLNKTYNFTKPRRRK